MIKFYWYTPIILFNNDSGDKFQIIKMRIPKIINGLHGHKYKC